MFHFTKEERIVLSILGLVILVGSSVHAAFKKYPHLKTIVNFIDSENIYAKIDINSASKEELVSIPYIGEYTALNIIQYRQENGPFTSVEQIKLVKGIRDKNYEKFRSFLKISQSKD